MDIDEAAAVVGGPRTPRWNEAFQVLWHFTAAKARRAGATHEEAEDIAQSKLLKTLTRLTGGDHIPNVPAHLAKCARHAAIDLRRQDRRGVALPDDLPEPTADESADDDESLDLATTVIDRAVEFARAQRSPRYQPDFDLAWAQMQAIFYDETPLRELLSENLADSSEATFVKARNSAYQTHSRVRKALYEAIEQLHARNELTAAEAELGRSALQVFVRCQREDAPGVNQARGAP